jgi:hypothetical protein
MTLLHIASSIFFSGVLAFALTAIIKTLTGEWK